MKKLFSSKQKTLEKALVQGESPSSDQTTNTSGSQEETAGQVLDATIQIIQQVTDLVPLDIAKDVLKGITNILLLLQKNVQNKSTLLGLARRCDVICSTLAHATKDVSTDDTSNSLINAVRTLGSSIDRLYSNMAMALQRGRVRRFVGATLEEKQISEWTSELDSTLTLFSASVNIVSGIRSDRTYNLLKHRDLPRLKPDYPPAPPAMFFGRDEIFIRIKDALLRDENIALIGPGGIGKSSIAKALINDHDILKRYARRFFVSYDGMDPVTITLGSFLDRIASALGLPMLGAESKQQVISNLASFPVFIVLDSAEKFEDAASPDTVQQISSMVSEIANTKGVTVMLTSRTSRNARDADWVQIEVPPLERVPARQYFRKIYRGDVTDGDVDELLGALDFHPLSIRILAYTAKESGWLGNELLDNWRAQHSQLLRTGHKKENLEFTIQLSLRSPSVRIFGDDAWNVLHMITFFPQGVNRNYVKRLFPSIPTISSLLDNLCNVSLVYCSGEFFTTLAPVRLFSNTAQDTKLDLLADIRHMYYESVRSSSENKDSHASLIMSDHLNIEHLIAYDIMHPLDNVHNATHACSQFLQGLLHHKLRPTSLAPLIPSLPDDSHDEKCLKACCLGTLAGLYFELSNFSLSASTCVAAHTLFVAARSHSMASSCISGAAISYHNQGYYARAQHLLQNFIQSPSWQHLATMDKAEIYFTLDCSKMGTSHDGADKLFLSSMGHPYRGLESYIMHWKVRMCHGYSTPSEVEKNLDSIRSHCIASPDARDRWVFFSTMAEVASLQGRFDIAMESLDHAHNNVDSDGDSRLTMVALSYQAALASVQGNHEFARSILQYTHDMLGVPATSASTELLQMRYVHCRNELYAKNYSEARRLLTIIITDCDIPCSVKAKTSSMRALGEVELLLGSKFDSDHAFAQTVGLCNEAGVPPELLDVCEPLLKLDDEEFPGWMTYLRGQTSQ